MDEKHDSTSTLEFGDPWEVRDVEEVVPRQGTESRKWAASVTHFLAARPIVMQELVTQYGNAAVWELIERYTENGGDIRSRLVGS